MGRLLIDARSMATGLGTYTANIVRGASSCPEFNLRLIVLPEHEALLKPICSNLISVKAPMYSLSEQLAVPWIGRNADVLHVPHYNIPLAYSKCLLTTIHDVTHIVDRTFRKTPKSWLYAQPMLRLAAFKADHIFTVSQYSKRQIIELLGADERKITVAYNGVSAHIFPAPRDESRLEVNRLFGFEGHYILFVGNLKPHKNINGLLNAFSTLVQRHRLPHKLLIVGDDSAGRPAAMQKVRDLNLGEIAIFVPHVSDSLLRSLYSGADITVLPSFEEGFGLPVLESMACGTPVACSATSALPEVADTAAEYFDPRDRDSICEALGRVLLSTQHWADLQRLGLLRAQSFTWEASSRLHNSVYRQHLQVCLA